MVFFCVVHENLTHFAEWELARASVQFAMQRVLANSLQIHFAALRDNPWDFLGGLRRDVMQIPRFLVRSRSSDGSANTCQTCKS